MGELENEVTGRRFLLPSRFIVGRSESSELSLTDARVSGEHATLYFDSGFWVVRDLASRNGTLVNGVSVGAGERRLLALGDRLAFGSESETWILVDESGPNDAAIERTVQATFELAEVTLELTSSQDEESLTIVLATKTARTTLPERAFHYLLLTLARARAQDQTSGVAEEEAGWVSLQDLIPGLYPDQETLNVHLYRARKQFIELGAKDARGLIERRVPAKQVRLGISRLVLARHGEK
jgi:pSer/pThr/pTyr-binding forkhead associated (FHA) protein